MKKLYDVVYHNDSDGLLASCSIEEITLLEEAPNGAIIARTSAGDIFRGSLDDYYDSKEDAIEDLIADLDNCIASHREEIEKLRKEILTMKQIAAVFRTKQCC